MSGSCQIEETQHRYDEPSLRSSASTHADVDDTARRLNGNRFNLFSANVQLRYDPTWLLVFTCQKQLFKHFLHRFLITATSEFHARYDRRFLISLTMSYFLLSNRCVFSSDIASKPL